MVIIVLCYILTSVSIYTFNNNLNDEEMIVGHIIMLSWEVPS